MNVVQFPMVLGLDVGGRPVDWLPWQDAVCLHLGGDVAWEAGSEKLIIHGGVNHATGVRSVVEVASIIAIRNARSLYKDNVPVALTNQALFARDRRMCMYCGEQCPVSLLTRDHIVPRVLGGKDQWTNVTSACKPCNQNKAGMTLEQAGMRLLAVPYAPSPIEALLLENRKILFDQQEFLLKHVPRSRRKLMSSILA